MTIKRYNAGLQRAKGLVELAAALYDSSLSSESWKAAEGVLQTDSRLGNALRLSLTAKASDKNGISLSFATGSFREIEAVAEGNFSLAWVNPSVLLTMAYRGKGPFRKRLPLRTLAVFPSMTSWASRSMNPPASLPSRRSGKSAFRSNFRPDS